MQFFFQFSQFLDASEVSDWEIVVAGSGARTVVLYSQDETVSEPLPECVTLTAPE